MKRTRVQIRWIGQVVLTLLIAVFAGQAQDRAAQMAAPGILTRDQAAAILPPSVFFRGQSATVQGRNSSGIQMKDGKLVLAAVVDTGGYSTSIQQRYQAYLITEVPLDIGGKRLPPGAYGFGFVAGDRAVVMDVGENDVLNTTTKKDTSLARPTPLQITADPDAPGRYRLYLGRTYLVLTPDGGK